MATIAFPGISESFIRVMHEVLSGFFDGSTHNFGDQTNVLFPDCDIVFSVKRLDRDSDKPVIAILGERAVRHTDEKCNYSSDARDFAYEATFRLDRTVIVRTKLAIGSTSPEQTFRETVQLYDLLVAVFLTEWKTFAEKGISVPALTPACTEIPDKENNLLRGVFSCVARAMYVRTNS